MNDDTRADEWASVERDALALLDELADDDGGLLGSAEVDTLRAYIDARKARHEREVAALTKERAQAVADLVKARTDLRAALCEGAFRIDRDPLDMQGVLYAVQDGTVSTGWARDALRRWMAGLPARDIPSDPDPNSPVALQAKAEAERDEALAEAERLRGLVEQLWRALEVASATQDLLQDSTAMAARAVEREGAVRAELEATGRRLSALQAAVQRCESAHREAIANTDDEAAQRRATAAWDRMVELAPPSCHGGTPLRHRQHRWQINRCSRCITPQEAATYEAVEPEGLWVVRVARPQGNALYLTLKYWDACSVTFTRRDALYFRSKEFAEAMVEEVRKQHPSVDSGVEEA